MPGVRTQGGKVMPRLDWKAVIVAFAMFYVIPMFVFALLTATTISATAEVGTQVATIEMSLPEKILVGKVFGFEWWFLLSPFFAGYLCARIARFDATFNAFLVAAIAYALQFAQIPQQPAWLVMFWGGVNLVGAMCGAYLWRWQASRRELSSSNSLQA